MKQHSLKQLSLRYGLIILGIVLLLLLASFLFFRTWLVNARTVEIEQSLVIRADDIGQHVGFYRAIVKKLAQQPRVMDLMQFGTPQENFEWALGMQGLLPGSIGLALFNAQGEMLGNPAELRVGTRCIEDMQAYIHGTALRETPVHQNIAAFAHFDVVENVVVDGQVAGVLFASFSLDILQQELDRLTNDDEVFEILSDDQQLMARSGDLGGRTVQMEKKLPIAGTGWILHARVAELPVGMLLLQIGLMAMLSLLLMSVAWYVFARKLVNTFSTDLGHIQQLLVHVKDNHAPQEEPVHSSLRETEHVIQGIHHLAQDISFYQQRLVDFSITDELTGLFNRRAFGQQAERCIELARRGMEVSVVMLDLDYFKQANDAFGHAMGDELLKAMARCLRRHVRVTDIAARLGGDEFVVLLVQCNQEQAFFWYRKVARDFEEQQQSLFDVAADIRLCSISAGFTQINENDDIDSVLKRADEALYKAKGAGRGKMMG